MSKRKRKNTDGNIRNKLRCQNISPVLPSRIANKKHWASLIELTLGLCYCMPRGKTL